jgi:hypothetical protein
MGAESTAQCTWCGEPVERGDGWRVLEIPGARSAVFCRLEHVVPWHIQGSRWEAGDAGEPAVGELEHCSHCGEPLGDVRVLAIRHRGEHRIPDAFCSADHLAAWARAGGRWG